MARYHKIFPEKVSKIKEIEKTLNILSHFYQFNPLASRYAR